MKFLIPTVVLLVLSISSSMRAEPASQKSSVEWLANAVVIAYQNENLGVLDTQHPSVGKVAIAIQHSLSGDGDRPDS
jgi:hypothetical protein